jgi:hypothetical protein
MQKLFLIFLIIVSSTRVFAADPEPEVALSRIDCGRYEQLSMADYDDTVFDGARRDAVESCYVVRHGSEFMLWDTGISVDLSGTDGVAKVIGPKRSVKDVLVEHGIKPEHQAGGVSP